MVKCPRGKFVVYLAGLISGEKLDECREWRGWFKQKFVDEPVVFLDPLEGYHGAITPDGLKSEEIEGLFFVQRDRWAIKNADVVIANLERFDKNRCIIGTLFEICWACEERKPIIVITTEPQYKHHPFITSCAVVVESLEEATKYLRFFMSIRETKTRRKEEQNERRGQSEIRRTY